MGTRAEKTQGKVVAGRPGRLQLVDRAVPHLCAGKPRETTGEQDRPQNPRFQQGEIKL